MKISAIIVTYNPDVERLSENIESIKKQVDFVILIDNNSANFNCFSNLISNDNMFFIRMESNFGIASALNHGIKKAKNLGCEYVITLDQDSVASDSMVNGLVEASKLNDDTSMIGPTINDYNTEIQEHKQGIELAPFLITSGALAKVDDLISVGLFDERLFIDCVDFDLNLRLISSGFMVYRTNDVYLNHEIGRKEQKKLFCRKFYILNHSDFRVYHMARNRIFLMLKYRNVQCYPLFEDIKHFVSRTLGMLIFESDKGKKFLATVKGIRDGFTLYSSQK
ncbi:glycosyltransferase family 2 protein [Vibrio vulnificus]|uniref:glycosyltransferase family 2 protein n=1 Tax=Vibrio vulnificus TaxID=672 RepID=UPI001CC922C6|nr:glycosyltransferase family 2 protein [Vibrio vulnificus]MCA0772206.1 glycosyltransferase family 2 protein [Vibrio vulnificus]